MSLDNTGFWFVITKMGSFCLPSRYKIYAVSSFGFGTESKIVNLKFSTVISGCLIGLIFLSAVFGQAGNEHAVQVLQGVSV